MSTTAVQNTTETAADAPKLHSPVSAATTLYEAVRSPQVVIEHRSDQSSGLTIPWSFPTPSKTSALSADQSDNTAADESNVMSTTPRRTRHNTRSSPRHADSGDELSLVKTPAEMKVRSDTIERETDERSATRMLRSFVTKASSTQTEIDSEEVAVGISKDQYKPRPSRSRSTRTALPEVDWTIAPENSTKRKKTEDGDTRESRRRKRAKVANEPRLPELSENIAKLEAMGFSACEAAQILEDCENQLEVAIEHLLGQGTAAQASEALQQTTGGGVAESDERQTALSHSAVCDVKDTSAAPLPASTINAEPSKGKKRGRPRKSQSGNAKKTIVIQNEENDAKGDVHEEVLYESPQKPLELLDERKLNEAASGVVSAAELDVNSGPIPKAPDILGSDVGMKPPTMPADSSKPKGNRVTYRVGLSKRYRIAPLLSIRK